MMIAHKNAILQIPVGIDVSLYSKLISLEIGRDWGRILGTTFIVLDGSELGLGQDDCSYSGAISILATRLAKKSNKQFLC